MDSPPVIVSPLTFTYLPSASVLVYASVMPYPARVVGVPVRSPHATEVSPVSMVSFFHVPLRYTSACPLAGEEMATSSSSDKADAPSTTLPASLLAPLVDTNPVA